MSRLWSERPFEMRRGFTLIETLVVIALIATLAAMLFPVFAQVKRPAKGTACIGNLRQIGMAINLYGLDADERYPLATDPVDANSRCAHREALRLPQLHAILAPYVKSAELWHCPLDTGVPDVHGRYEEAVECDLPGIASIFGAYGSSYVYRSDLALANVSQPASLFDPYHGREEHGPAEVPLVVDAYGAWHGEKEEGGRRYNAVMADGHVQRRTQSQIAIAEDWTPD